MVYVGSIRNANNINVLLDSAKKVKNSKIKFLIWGDGDQLTALEERVNNEGIDNVVFKGRVDKKYIPYITSCADLNIVHGSSTPIVRFGMSLNKFFDCLAAGKPILVDFESPYNPVVEEAAAIKTRNSSPECIAETIDNISRMKKDVINEYCKNARKGAEKYDFTVLTNKLINVIEGA